VTTEPIADEWPFPDFMHWEVAVFLLMSEGAVAEDKGRPFVRIAELEVDPAHLERFKASTEEQTEAAVRVEPGVFGSLRGVRKG
jgi:hypothetical protein